MKRREILTHAATQMNHEGIGLSERSQTQQDSIAQSHLCEVPVCQIHQGGRYSGGCPWLVGGGVESYCLMATEFQLWVLKTFWSWLVVTVMQLLECVECH